MVLQGRSTKFALLVVFALVATTTASVKDGLPRPTGVDDKPSVTYGNVPAVTYNGSAATCTWYGFKDLNYNDTDTSQCLSDAWGIINSTTPSSLKAYGYYWLQSYYDAKYKEYLCYIGCFDLGASSPASPPSTPPSTPPTTSPTSAPPVSMSPPPPASLFQPPPPPMTPAPSTFTPSPSIAPSITPSITPTPTPTVVPTPSPVVPMPSPVVPTPTTVLEGPSSSPLTSPTPAKSTVPAPSTTPTSSVGSPAKAPAPPVGSGSSIRPAGWILLALVFATATISFVAVA